MAARGIYLIGFSGSGKSTIAQLVGAHLDWPVYDLDRMIIEQSGMIIPTIFQREGEAGFRIRETEALRTLPSAGAFVVATGGGVAVRVENRRIMARNGWIITLEGRPESLHDRMQRQLQKAEPEAIRPMLDAVYPLEQVRALKHSRQSVYALADWTVHTDRLSAQQVASEVVRAVELLEQTADPPAAFDVPSPALRHALNADVPPPVIIAAGAVAYQVVIGWEHLDALGTQVQRLLPRAQRVAVITDAATWQRLGDAVRASLSAIGLAVHVREVVSDERSKTLEQADALYDWLLHIRLRRDDLVMVVGGGALNDLGGFVASTYMRGVPLITLPTSLDGMVDSAIGGKTALNHRQAHNLVGTLYHPRLVWADAALLRAEPPRALRAAWAEVVKYAMLENTLLQGDIPSPTLFAHLEHSVDALASLERQPLLQVIARCVALKAQVVAADEHDIAQHRMLLNYGHTVGHALETATNYTMLHGEAVAIGMAVEACLATRLGLASPTVAQRQNELLLRFGLPIHMPPVDLDLLIELMNRDKKVFGDAPRWILPTDIGRASISRAVDEADVRGALTAMRATS